MPHLLGVIPSCFASSSRRSVLGYGPFSHSSVRAFSSGVSGGEEGHSGVQREDQNKSRCPCRRCRRVAWGPTMRGDGNPLSQCWALRFAGGCWARRTTPTTPIFGSELVPISVLSRSILEEPSTGSGGQQLRRTLDERLAPLDGLEDGTSARRDAVSEDATVGGMKTGGQDGVGRLHSHRAGWSGSESAMDGLFGRTGSTRLAVCRRRKSWFI